MVLQKVGHSDEGTYICTAENGVAVPDTAAAMLTVLRKFFLRKSIPQVARSYHPSMLNPCWANIRLMFVDKPFKYICWPLRPQNLL